MKNSDAKIEKDITPHVINASDIVAFVVYKKWLGGMDDNPIGVFSGEIARYVPILAQTKNVDGSEFFSTGLFSYRKMPSKDSEKHSCKEIYSYLKSLDTMELVVQYNPYGSFYFGEDGIRHCEEKIKEFYQDDKIAAKKLTTIVGLSLEDIIDILSKK